MFGRYEVLRKKRELSFLLVIPSFKEGMVLWVNYDAITASKDVSVIIKDISMEEASEKLNPTLHKFKKCSEDSVLLKREELEKLIKLVNRRDKYLSEKYKEKIRFLLSYHEETETNKSKIKKQSTERYFELLENF